MMSTLCTVSGLDTAMLGGTSFDRSNITVRRKAFGTELLQKRNERLRAVSKDLSELHRYLHCVICFYSFVRFIFANNSDKTKTFNP